jgi:hypothetical protein
MAMRDVATASFAMPRHVILIFLTWEVDPEIQISCIAY